MGCLADGGHHAAATPLTTTLLFSGLKSAAQRDFKMEADRSAAAVESAEEDLKDLKKLNKQVSSWGVLQLLR